MLLCETNGHYDPVIGRMVITDRYKYVETADDMSELYDLELDPYELTNLIKEPDYAQIKIDMQARLQILLQQNKRSIIQLAFAV